MILTFYYFAENLLAGVCGFYIERLFLLRRREKKFNPNTEIMEQVTDYLQKCLSDAQDKISVARDLCQEIDRTIGQTKKIPDIEPIKSVINDAILCMSVAILDANLLRDPGYMDKELDWTI
jgi:hypothetical protein